MYLHAVNFSLSLTSRTVPWRAARTGGGGARLGAAARERGVAACLAADADTDVRFFAAEAERAISGAP